VSARSPVRNRDFVTAPWASGETQRRLLEIQAGSPCGSEVELRQAAEAAAAHGRAIDEEGLVLYAGSNGLGHKVAALHDSQIGVRPSMGLPGEKVQHGLEHLEVIEVLTTRAVAATFHADYADVRIQSGTLANLAGFIATAEIGATLGVLPESAGVHVSHTAAGVAGIRGYRIVELPYDFEAMDVDLAALPAFMQKERPALIVLGPSLFLFPHRLEALALIAHEFGSRVLYDASHVAGLVAGGCFQDPLEAGADIATFSTYKSYGGPPGGAIVTNDEEIAARISAAVFPRLTANFDAGRLRGLLATANYLLRDGGIYARQCLTTARALAHGLHDRGLGVCGAERGFTESHHLAIRIGDRIAADNFTKRLASAGIYLSAALAPVADKQAWVLRIGTQELVRRGFNATDMNEVAQVVARVLAGEAPDTVRPAVQELLRNRLAERWRGP
jgi:glycine hydroxymethyltransferase